MHLARVMATGVAVLCLTPWNGSAQAIRGKVAVIDIGEPIAKAAVLLLGEDGVAYAATLTDSAGHFELETSFAGRFVLRAHRVGYHGTSSDPIELAPGRIVEVRINLRPDAIMLEAITVYGRVFQSRQMKEFLRRRRLGLSRYSFSRSEIEQMRAGTILNVVTQVPGARVVGRHRNRSMRLNARGCPPRIYIDGNRAYHEFFSVPFPIDWIEAIEVFRTASETPAYYRDPDYRIARCGTILIWTVSIK